jgi:hypothetical protein
MRAMRFFRIVRALLKTKPPRHCCRGGMNNSVERR